LKTLKIPFGPQPDHTTTIRTTIQLKQQGLVEAVKNSSSKTMPPYTSASASWAALGPGPWIISAFTKKNLEYDRKKEYHWFTYWDQDTDPGLEKGGVSARTLGRPFLIKKSLSQRGSFILIIFFPCQPNLKIRNRFTLIESAYLQCLEIFLILRENTKVAFVIEEDMSYCFNKMFLENSALSSCRLTSFESANAALEWLNVTLLGDTA
jgi:hypothetical protein